MCLVSIGIWIAWISTSQSRDNSKQMEFYWRKNYIESRALLNLSLRQTDYVIDQITAQQYEMWDVYCERKYLFRQNMARKAMETN
jgi:hypothetical protein